MRSAQIEPIHLAKISKVIPQIAQNEEHMKTQERDGTGEMDWAIEPPLPNPAAAAGRHLAHASLLHHHRHNWIWRRRGRAGREEGGPLCGMGKPPPYNHRHCCHHLAEHPCHRRISATARRVRRDDTIR